ncbi:hypothetical protein [Leifsonia shinshuensis]|uniref:hypothetical protein n=1 Tax=Leifsonia shinshuensis TaxID=150026 RepID=UPI00285D8290|nr:hypothetical protein [Leifsonia shinshuensis]MDR6970655.1 hypothetical protein [Leifsonia shinshuensis]
MRGARDDRADTPRALGHEVGRLSLLALLEEAVTAAERADVLLARCDDIDVTTAADARLALRLRVAFADLQRWADDLELDGREAELRDEAARLCAFYLHLLTHAFDRRIASAGHDRRTIRSRGPLTGAPCARLALLRDRLRSLSAD